MKKNFLRISICIWLLFLVCLIGGCQKQTVMHIFLYGKVPEFVGRVESVSQDRYVYQTLNEEKRQTYDEILYVILNHKERVCLTTQDFEQVEECYKAVMADYGEIFWVKNCSRGTVNVFGKPFAATFAVDYAYTEEETEELKAQMQPVIDGYLKDLAACENDYEKSELVYRRLIEETAYDLDAENNQNILSVFLGKATVCQGYAAAAQYLLQQAGITNAIVTGTAQDEPHAWNILQLDGQYYFMDVTWGNTIFRDGDQWYGDPKRKVSYNYLNMTTDELQTTHEPGCLFPLAECTTTTDNYYKKHDLYVEKWDAEKIEDMITRSYADQSGIVSVKFADDELLQQTVDYFVNESHLTEIYKDMNEIVYSIDENLHILSFYF